MQYAQIAFSVVLLVGGVYFLQGKFSPRKRLYSLILFLLLAFTGVIGQMLAKGETDSEKQSLDIEIAALKAENTRLLEEKSNRDQQWRDELALVWQYDHLLHAADEKRTNIDLLKYAEPKDLRPILDRCNDADKSLRPEVCPQYGPGEMPAPIYIGVLGRLGPMIGYFEK